MPTLKLKYGAISTDEHIQEAPDVWTNRMSKAKFGDDIPHIVDLPSGAQEWRALGEPLIKSGDRGAGDRGALAWVVGATRNGVMNSRRWEDVPKTTYVPSERLKAMDQDQVDTHTFFPNIAGVSNTTFQKKGPPEFRLACLQAYNDWLAEEWAAFSPRYIAQCLPPLWDAQLAAAEIRRSVKNGHRAVVFHGAPELLGFRNFADPDWDPVFQTCTELDVPLCLHLGAVPRALDPWSQHSHERTHAITSTSHVAGHLHILAGVLFSGVLQRFPTIRIMLVEAGLGWIPHTLELADYEFETLNLKSEGFQRPTEMWRRHFYANFWSERFGIENRAAIGVDNIVYETDFPHVNTTWPNSKRAREESLRGVPQEDRAKMLVWNAAKVYHLDVDASALPELQLPVAAVRR